MNCPYAFPQSAFRNPQFKVISILQPYRILLDYFRKEIFSQEGKGKGEDAGFVNGSGF
jgi:hypothetical protein